MSTGKWLLKFCYPEDGGSNLLHNKTHSQTTQCHILQVLNLHQQHSNILKPHTLSVVSLYAYVQSLER